MPLGVLCVCQRFFFLLLLLLRDDSKRSYGRYLCVCVELPQREKEKEQKRKWTVSFWGGLLSLFILGGGGGGQWQRLAT